MILKSPKIQQLPQVLNHHPNVDLYPPAFQHLSCIFFNRTHVGFQLDEIKLAIRRNLIYK